MPIDRWSAATIEFQPALGDAALAMLVGLLLAGPCSRPSVCVGTQASRPTILSRPLATINRIVRRRAAGVGLAVCRRRQRPVLGQAAAAWRLSNSSRAPPSIAWRWQLLLLIYAGRAAFSSSPSSGWLLAGMRQNEESGWRSSATACSSSMALVFSARGMVAGLGGALYSYHIRASSARATWVLGLSTYRWYSTACWEARAP